MKKYSIVTIALFLCLSMFFHTSAIAIETLVPDTVYWEDKIDESVYESPIYENGKRLIYIQRESIPKELIAKNLKQKYNYSMDVYENEEEYEKQIVPAVTARVVAELGETAAYSTAEQLQLTGESISPVDRALSDDYNDYIMAKRAATKELYTASTDAFLENEIDNVADVLCQGQYTSSFILYASDTEIERYAKCKDVVNILPFEDYTLTSPISEASLSNSESISAINTTANTNSVPEEQTQIGVDSISGTKSSSFNSGAGLKGTGVKIGIIEVGRYQYDAPQLSPISSTSQLQFVYTENENGADISPSMAENDEIHATVVTSLIVGQAVTINGCVYEGVVPEATVYQTSINSLLQLSNACTKLLDCGVSIINFSGSWNNALEETSEEASNSNTYPDYYTASERELDEFVKDNNVTIIKSAGNDRENLSIPSKSYNIITVGNAHTKDSPIPSIGAASFPYKVCSTSSYQEASYLTNKPDLVAPGVEINVPVLIDEAVTFPENINSGTSFAAPLVTGIAAQLHQVKPFLRSNPYSTKALLLAGADPTVISTFDNPLADSQCLREKSGAGMANAVNSIGIALNNHFVKYSFNLNSNNWDMEYVDAFTVPAGKTARIVMTFSKPDTSDIPASGYENDVDIFIHDNTTEEEIASSTSYINNVELIEFTISSQRSRSFYINLEVSPFGPTSDPNTMVISLAYRFY